MEKINEFVEEEEMLGYKICNEEVINGPNQTFVSMRKNTAFFFPVVILNRRDKQRSHRFR